MSGKPKFPAETALAVLREILPALKLACELREDKTPWLIVCGSLRRRKPEVGDVEIVYVPQHGMVKDGLFEQPGNRFDAALGEMLKSRVLQPRLNAKSQVMWGPKNKLALHVASGLPIDFFATKMPDFWNYVVCRTGSAENNIRIATSAQERGLKWLPYDGGFQVTDAVRASAAVGRSLYTGQVIAARTEPDVFSIAGLPYLEPWQRNA